MANHKSALKRIRQNEKLRLANRSMRNRVRTYVKKARTTLVKSTVEEARENVKQAVKELDHMASKGIIHARNAARRKSRLMKQLHALETSGK
ncbi:MAG: 30S ribosomal protein S20 [Burkholderiales bacterium]|nr:30S ribosomal protein S20 [Anaerolineae bacterium]